MHFNRGDKVKYNNELYDFGYMGATGKAIIYEEGECNAQDSYAVDKDKLELVSRVPRFNTAEDKAVDHIDGNIHNNDISNIRIVNIKDNIKV